MSYGAGGIRTPGTLSGYNSLAGSPIQPLSHRSSYLVYIFPSIEFASQTPNLKTPSLKSIILSRVLATEQVGFEPTVPCGTTVFKTASFNHSDTAPGSICHSEAVFQSSKNPQFCQLLTLGLVNNVEKIHNNINPQVLRGYKLMKVGIIGAGTMGCGIAQVFATTDGYSVVLCDISEEFATAGKKRIADGLEKLVSREKMSREAADKLLSGISTGLKEAASDCDLIIEAAAENMDLKKELFQSLMTICKKETIFASNTSSLSLTELSAGLDRHVIGMHFFNPAPVMKLVEIVIGSGTPVELVQKIKDISIAIGKTPVEVKDAPGFIVNRVLIPMINEAVGIFANGTASAEDIDTAMKLGASHVMGPLALGDLIGLDVCLAIMEVLHEQTGDKKYMPHPLLGKMVNDKQLGRKTGQGFHKYE